MPAAVHGAGEQDRAAVPVGAREEDAGGARQPDAELPLAAGPQAIERRDRGGPGLGVDR
jgi:hypothetical protein